MKLKTTYVLIWAILGIICSFFLSVFSFLIIKSSLNNITANGSILPFWAHIIVTVFSILAFIFINMLFISIGFKRGEKYTLIYDRTKKGKKIANIILVVSVIVLLEVSLFITFYINNIKRIDNEIKQSVIKISSIFMERLDDGFDIIVNIAGKSLDEYSLKINIKSSKYIKADLVDISNRIPLKFNKQIFRFFISFKEIEDAYYKKLMNDFAVNPEVKTYIDEDADISVTLTMVESFQYSKEELARNHIEPSVKRAVAKFYFECLKDECKIIQKDDKQETPVK